MSVRLGKAKELTAGGETLFEKDLITDESLSFVQHRGVEERGFDCKVSQTLDNITPQPTKTFQNIDPPAWIHNPGENRRITSITFQAWTATPTTDAVLVIRRAGEPFYLKPLGVIGDTETTFDLTGPDFVPIDLVAGTAYTIDVVSASGQSVEFAGDFPNLPFYKYEYHTFEVVELGLREDVFPVVQTSVEGINFGGAQTLQSGGDRLFESNIITDRIANLVTHEFNETRATDRAIDVDSFIEDQPVFIVDADTLTNPSFLFSPVGDVRLTSINLKSAGAQTNVKFVIKQIPSNVVIWQSMISSIPVSGVFSIDFADTSESNVPIDLFDISNYSFEFTSEDGDVLLLGNNTGTQPWLEASSYQFADEDIAYLSDLTGIDGVFHVDINTTVPAADRDGSIFRPYQTINEAQTGAGPATVSAQHSFLIASGAYSETVDLGAFEHLASRNYDAQSVIINQINVGFTGLGTNASLQNLRANDIIYNTLVAGGTDPTVLYLKNVDSNGGIQITGRGAGSDSIIIDEFCNVDDFNPCTNVYLRITRAYPMSFTGNLSVAATADGTNLRDSHASITELNDVNFADAGNISMNVSSGKSGLMRLTNAPYISPLITFISGGIGIIEHDALSDPVIADLIDSSLNVLLDKGTGVEYDNSNTGLNAANVSDAIDALFLTPPAASSDVIYVSQESDFGNITPGISIQPSVNKTFVLIAPVTQTLPFVPTTGTSMQILAANKAVDQLTYTHATEAQFQGTNIAYSAFDVIFNGNETGTIFDTVGGSISFKFDDFNRYSSGGTVDGAGDFYCPGAFYEVIDDGFNLIDCGTPTFTEAIFNAQDGNALVLFTISGASSGNMHFGDCIINNDALAEVFEIQSSYPVGKVVRIDGNVLENPDKAFTAASLKEIDDRVDTANNPGVPNSEKFALINGSTDENPIVLSVAGATTYNTTSAKFAFIDETDPVNHKVIIKEYTAETNKTLVNTGVQRNVFMFMDVSQTPPVIFESLNPAVQQEKKYVSIGNFDLIDNPGPFDEIGGANTFVHTAYSLNDTAYRLQLTKGNYNIFGSEFTANVAANLTLTISAGRGIRIGGNVQVDYEDPDVIDGPVDVINNVNMQYIDTVGDTVTINQPGKDMDVVNYVPDGTLTAVSPVGRFQVMWLYKFYGSNSIRAHYGDTLYSTLDEAETNARLMKGPLVTSPQVGEAVLRTALIVAGNATDLTDPAQARFVQFD